MTLIERVQAALAAANNGTLTRTDAKTILSDVLTHLEDTPAGADQLAPETIDRITPALGTLSVSEMEAMQAVFTELDGNEGLLVASKIGDRLGITRSVIVNGLRKLEAGGLVQTRSLGMKGTQIKVMVPDLKRRLLTA